MAKQQRKHRTPQEKAELLRRHLLDKQPVSAVCEEAGVQPSNFYNWQRQLLDNAAAAFGDPERSSRRERELQEKIAALEARLARKDAVIAEITGEYVALKNGPPRGGSVAQKLPRWHTVGVPREWPNAFW